MVEPTHLKKYAQVKLDHLPQIIGVKIQKCLSCHHEMPLGRLNSKHQRWWHPFHCPVVSQCRATGPRLDGVSHGLPVCSRDKIGKFKPGKQRVSVFKYHVTHVKSHDMNEFD